MGWLPLGCVLFACSGSGEAEPATSDAGTGGSGGAGGSAGLGSGGQGGCILLGCSIGYQPISSNCPLRCEPIAGFCAAGYELCGELRAGCSADELLAHSSQEACCACVAKACAEVSCAPCANEQASMLLPGACCPACFDPDTNVCPVDEAPCASVTCAPGSSAVPGDNPLCCNGCEISDAAPDAPVAADAG